MISRDIQLRKRLIKDAIIFVVALVVLSGGGALVSNYDDDAQSEAQHKDEENSKLHSEIDELQTQISNGSEISAYYDIYSKNHNSDLALNREAVTGRLAELREKNHLVNLVVTISPISDVPGDVGALHTGKAIQSDVKLVFSALTDNSVYGFIESLQRQLPGIVLIYDLKLSRNKELTGDILRDLSQHKLTPMVSAELSFLWLGIRPNAEEKPGAEGHAHGK